MLKKKTKRARGERVLVVLVPLRDQFCTLKLKVLYPQLQLPKENQEVGQQERIKERARRGQSNISFVVHLIVFLSAPNGSPRSL